MNTYSQDGRADGPATKKPNTTKMKLYDGVVQQFVSTKTRLDISEDKAIQNSTCSIQAAALFTFVHEKHKQTESGNI